ncbi:hypothetical protein TWF281_003705 [Arthrobotrys megalospora]
MTRAVSSIYTSFLDAPPAACVSVPFHPSDGSDPQAPGGVEINSTPSAGNSSGGGRDQGDGGSAARARSLLVTGTYTLDKETSLRHGSLILHEAALEGKQDGTNEQIEVKLVQTVPLPSGSVLDIRLLKLSATRSFPDGSKLAVATSTGQVSVYSISSESAPSLQLVSNHIVTDDTTLILSLAISPDGLLLAATTSQSAIVILKFTDNTFTSLQPVAEISDAHTSLEAWTSVFSTDGTILYSGGDDASFAAWDVGSIETTSDEDQVVQQVYRNRKVHTAGVTSILPVTISGMEYIFTGSYDQHIRVYSPSTKRWLDGEVDLDGGVWRLERLTDHQYFRLQDHTEKSSDENIETVWILASCMHAGCCVLKTEFIIGEDRVVVTPVATMKEHESMNYASACVWHGSDGRKEPTFISTSFYDQRFCCWKL